MGNNQDKDEEQTTWLEDLRIYQTISCTVLEFQQILDDVRSKVQSDGFGLLLLVWDLWKWEILLQRSYSWNQKAQLSVYYTAICTKAACYFCISLLLINQMLWSLWFGATNSVLGSAKTKDWTTSVLCKKLFQFGSECFCIKLKLRQKSFLKCLQELQFLSCKPIGLWGTGMVLKATR